jgi:DNA-binding LacI/PurR family transcriptional regulator
MKTTIVDVAKAAGVSVSVVSRVLMGRGYVNAGKREHILKTMRELDYHPSPLAKGLRDGRTNTLGLLFFWLRTPFLPDYYQREILAGVLDACVTRNYQLLINNFMGEMQDLEADRFQCKRIVKDPRAEGLLVVNPPEALMEVFRKAPERVVLVNRQDPKLSFSDADQQAAMQALVEHLIAKGHTRIGLLAGDTQRDSSAEPRKLAFQESMKKQGLALEPELIFEGHFSEDSGSVGARYFAGLENPPTALVASTDSMALGALRYLRGLAPKKRLAIVSIDDSPDAALPENALTTMHQPFYEMGRKAAETLIQRLAAPESEPVQSLLPMQLIVRKSA